MRSFLITALIAIAAPLSAHDFWIEPSTFRPARGELVALSLRVGQNFVGDPIPRSTQWIESFTVREGKDETTVAGLENRDPAGFVRLAANGMAIIGYRSKPQPIELSPEKFSEFLRQEGFEPRPPGREFFSRYAKVILGSSLAQWKPFGYRLEIVPEDATQFRVLLEGKPYANALVTAIHHDDTSARLSVRTDSDGRVKLMLPKPGVWLVKCVALLPAAASSGARWESLWASVTFER